ncbi:MAG TPA: isoprenylcysteine carboxylmethyltransferase family protein [Candidatus Dormibacteraeota bacterium]|jgi:protein-S-isoprenylcysteine O-methyltransferase Ste14|nr:isoprenylcysteine carboxylmethyltransferase family protein [Candidatus Dormibacteraeota bacterium]
MTLEVAAPRLRTSSTDALRLTVFGRVVPAIFFALLGYAQLTKVVSSVRGMHPVSIGAVLSGPLPAALYLLFCLIPVLIYVGRPAPRARDGRVLPRVAGLAGTLMLLVTGTLPQGDQLYTTPTWLGGVSSAATIVAFAAAVCGLLYLRRSLSIIPEVRRLVTGGPYRLVRHPLYAAEILAAVAFVAAKPGALAVAVLAPFIAVQLLRSRFEERLLTEAYPHYRDYARRTRRLIPLIW